MDKHSNGYLRVGKVAEELEVTRQAIHQMIGDGRIHAVWMLDQWAIHEAEVKRVKEQRQKQSEAA